ncbi:MAG TPA: MGMT family protein [Chthoniobacteraceae bacterium]|jgi:methylated-DNA-protein-cysteine methyltransferase-like protein|nr:MGMT family protein [Chthoniobacteraceae bacterium]
MADSRLGMKLHHWFGKKSNSGDQSGEALERDHAFQRAIMAIPSGKVSTYGKIAESAGYPRYHRAVAQLLRREHLDRLPWHRVIGADGVIKTSGDSAKEQRARLRQEGVTFRGERVDIRACLHDARKIAAE